MIKKCNYNESSYIERMHKCSAAQWERRLELKDRDYHRTKLNNCKAGVVNTGSSNGFEPFKFSRRRRTVTKANSCASMMMHILTSDDKELLPRMLDININEDSTQSDLMMTKSVMTTKSDSYAYCSLLLWAADMLRQYDDYATMYAAMAAPMRLRLYTTLWLFIKNSPRL